MHASLKWWFHSCFPVSLCSWLKVWGKPLWSRKPVKLWCHQAWELRGFTQRRSERGAAESALMSSPWQERGATCPESGSRVVILSEAPYLLHHFVLTNPHLVSTYRHGAAASQGRREYTVGQYVVDLPSFENLALPLFRNVREPYVLFYIFFTHPHQ